jgi:pyrimidine-specific ribonucleoside hydrolase
MSGLDVTHKAMIMPEEIESLRKLGGKVPVLAAELMDFYSEYHRAQGLAGSPLHDPCAVAYIIKPELFVTKSFHIDIECQGKYTSGMTLADRRPWSKTAPNVTACLDLDRKGFIDLVVEACKSY